VKENDFVRRKKYQAAYKLSNLAFENKLFKMSHLINEFIISKDWENI